MVFIVYELIAWFSQFTLRGFEKVSLISRLKAVVAGDDYLDDDFDELDYESENDFNSINDQRVNHRNSSSFSGSNPFDFMNNNKSSKVIGMPGISNSSSEVNLLEPKCFDEMPQVIQALRERKTIILNLTMMDPDQAQRAVDFVAGGTYAIDGHQERVGESIFLFTPSCVNVTSSFPVEASPSNITNEDISSFGLNSNSAPQPAWGDSKLTAYS